MQMTSRVFSGGLGRSFVTAILVSQLICLAATVSGPVLAASETVQVAVNQTKSAEPLAAPAALNGVGRYLLDSGDKIKVRIYQRDDLSGDFLVGTRGTIALPLLGTFRVAGLDEDQVRTAISEAARKVMERSVDVVVDVTERRPIYIVGYVERPGVYPFALGMTVVHALSMSGGAYRPQAANRILDFSKELTQVQTDTDTLKRNIVRLARLQAERDAKPFTAVPPELSVLTGAAEARDLFEREQRLQASETEARQNQIDASRRSRDYAKQELEDLRQKVAQIDNQLKLNQTRKSALKTLISKGFTRTLQVTDAETNDATLTLGKLDILATITHATRTYEDLKSEASTKELSRKQELDTQINVLTTQIESIKKSRQITDATVRQNAPGADYNGETQLNFSLMRRSATGYVNIPATDVTSLLPGDVLRVALQQTITASGN